MPSDWAQRGGANMRKIGTLVLIVTGLATGCQQPTNTVALEARIISLESQVAVNGKLVDDLASKLAEAVSSSHTHQSFAMIKPTDEHYNTIQTNLLPVLVSLKSIEPIANGSRVTVRVGNPHLVLFNGAELVITPFRDHGAGGDSLQPITHPFLGTLPPGTWTEISFNVGVKPDEIFLLMVGVELDVIRLN